MVNSSNQSSQQTNDRKYYKKTKNENFRLISNVERERESDARSSVKSRRSIEVNTETLTAFDHKFEHILFRGVLLSIYKRLYSHDLKKK